MKITFRNLIKGAFAMMLLIVMAACGQKIPSAEEVAGKIDNNATLTEADYTSMIDYCGDYAKDAQKYYDIINAEPTDSTAEAIRATDDLASLYEKYNYLEKFRDVLENTNLTSLGVDNEKKVAEFAKYQGFPLPVGAGADLRDPKVVGMIEDMPDTTATDSTGVIATGDGEAVDINVK